MWQADAEALADRLRGLLTVVRSAEAEIGTLLVEIESRGVMELFGYRSVARLLEHLADIPHAAAQRTVARARALASTHTLDSPPALAPATGVAALTGALSTPMIDTIITALTPIPLEHRDTAEQDLLAFAADAGHKQVAALGARILAHLDPDGAEPVDVEPATPARELSLRRRRTGTWELTGRFDDETGTRASALLDALAERRTADDGADFRSPQERYGDAFSDAIDLALNSPELPTQAGERAHVLVAVSLADLQSGLGQATLGDTGLIPAVEARIHACDCKLIPVRFGRHQRTPGPGPSPPPDLTRPPPSPVPARPRLRLPRLPPPTAALPRPPHPPLGRRRPHGPGQPGAALRPPSPAHAPLGLAGPPRDRRPPRIPTPGVPGQASKTQAQQHPPTTPIRSLTQPNTGKARSHRLRAYTHNTTRTINQARHPPTPDRSANPPQAIPGPAPILAPAAPSLPAVAPHPRPHCTGLSTQLPSFLQRSFARGIAALAAHRNC